MMMMVFSFDRESVFVYIAQRNYIRATKILDTHFYIFCGINMKCVSIKEFLADLKKNPYLSTYLKRGH